jgi:hypothetical protein
MLRWTVSNQPHTCLYDVAPVAYPSRRPEFCVQTMISLPVPACVQNTRPIAMSEGIVPDAS